MKTLGRPTWFRGVKNCAFCKKEFRVTAWDRDKKYCDMGCLKSYYLTNGAKQSIKCSNCGKMFRGYVYSYNKRYTCSKRCLGIRNGALGVGDRGENVSYAAKHHWAERKLGKPMYCFLCRTRKESLYDWANISGKYFKRLDDWVRLCRKCHRWFDGEGIKKCAQP